MKSRHLNFIFLLIFFSQQVLGIPHRIQFSKLLDHLKITSKSSKPLIVIVNSKTKWHKEQNSLHSSTDKTSDNDGLDHDGETKEEAKNFLSSYLLRDEKPNQDNAQKILENEQKSVLKAVLRSRCNALDKCIWECKKKEKKKNCNYCKKIYDKNKLCESSEEKSCGFSSDECNSRESYGMSTKVGPMTEVSSNECDGMSSKSDDCYRKSSKSDECDGKSSSKSDDCYRKSSKSDECDGKSSSSDECGKKRKYGKTMVPRWW